jgi:hypothetical protein
MNVKLSNQKSVVCFPTPVRWSYLRAYKAPFYVSFCTFCASLRLIRTVFTRLLKTFVCLLSTGNRQLETGNCTSTKEFVRKNKLFLQNKANFRKVKLDVNNVLTRVYEQMDTWSIRKTKPIKAKPVVSLSNLFKPNLSRRSLWRSRKQTQSPRPCCGKPPYTLSEDTLQKPVCIFKTYCYIDDQWNPASPPGFTNFYGWISIFSFHNKIIIGEPS